MSRIYKVVLAAGKSDWEANQEKEMLKQTYDEYLKVTSLVTEDKLISLLKTGRVMSAENIGSLEQ